MAWLSVFRLAPGDNLHRHNKARIFLSLINRCRQKIEINMKIKYFCIIILSLLHKEHLRIRDKNKSVALFTVCLNKTNNSQLESERVREREI